MIALNTTVSFESAIKNPLLSINSVIDIKRRSGKIWLTENY